MSETTKGGNVVLRSVSVPDTVAPGERFTVEATVRNGAAYIDPFDPDGCNVGASESRGYELEVNFDGPGRQEATDGPACHKSAVVGVNEVVYSTTFQAPETEGPEAVSATVKLLESGKETAAVSDRLTVTENAPSQPEDRDGQGDTGPIFGDGSSDPNAPGGSGPFSDLEGTANIVVGLIVVVAWALDSGAEIAG